MVSSDATAAQEQHGSSTSYGPEVRWRVPLTSGVVIPAHPLALTPSGQLDERRQRALSRYYIAAGAGGLAVGVHTTQFAIRDPQIGLYRPVLQIAAEEMDRADATRNVPLVRVAGICGPTHQAMQEAALARDLGYHAGLLSLASLRDADDDTLIAHCREVATILPLFGFYLQPAVGGRPLSCDFWRRFAEIEAVVAIKIAPFDRYRTLDVVRAVVETERHDIALYTGNDDHIVLDLITPFRFRVQGKVVERRIVGGLLGHWAVWTRGAVAILEECRRLSESGAPIPADLLALANAITDCNAAFFDAAHCFRGCIAGLHEVLRRQGLLESVRCLDPNEGLSPGQNEEIDRVYRTYPHLNDDDFVAAHRDEWLR
ncbi:MAG: dihydrodipicolinate synthase family protein [Chloroherpetonaceae bacterium]|nr:dihydrodipicolinate synthase family protein [Chthonomonadaceae bacterium]MDW8207125.1 dihydrodipicolinate synthase family protein [Chloroherpetonaceae bacterium]